MNKLGAVIIIISIFCHSVLNNYYNQANCNIILSLVNGTSNSNFDQTTCDYYLVQTIDEHNCNNIKYYVGMPNVGNYLVDDMVDIMYDTIPALPRFLERHIRQRITYEFYHTIDSNNSYNVHSNLLACDNLDIIKSFNLVHLTCDDGEKLGMVEIDVYLYKMIKLMPQELINSVNNYVALRVGISYKQKKMCERVFVVGKRN